MTPWPSLGPYAELIGYMAASLVLLTFLMRTMLSLRLLGLASNVAFLTYALAEDLMPIFLLHVTLIPINLYRLQEIPKFREVLRRRLRFKARADHPTSGTLACDDPGPSRQAQPSPQLPNP